MKFQNFDVAKIRDSLIEILSEAERMAQHYDEAERYRARSVLSGHVVKIAKLLEVELQDE